MPLDTSKLESVVFRGDAIQARCPACAERGSDKSGNHLRIYPDGRFGCAVCRGDREHRQRIWSLAGGSSSGGRRKQKPQVRTVKSVGVRRWRRFSDAPDGLVEVPAGRIYQQADTSDGTDGSMEPLSIREHTDSGSTGGSTTTHPSVPSELIPLDKPFEERMRYREADMCEVRNRLDLYYEDPNGPWVRLHGNILLAALNSSSGSPGQKPTSTSTH